MTKLTLISAILVGCLAGCSSKPAPTSPADEPALPEEEMAEPEMSEPEMSEPEVAEPEAAEPEASEPAPPEDEGRPSCGGLPKARCKVTQGCAYHDQNGCVSYGEQ